MSITCINHVIKNSTYNGNVPHEEGTPIPVSVSGGMSVSRNGEPRVIFVEYHFVLGEEDNNPILVVDTKTVFNYSTDTELTDDQIKAVCLPEAQKRLHEDVSRLLKDYGEDSIKLPELNYV